MTGRPLPVPAATVVLLRDGPEGVEVFMQRRHGRSGFMAGATVFPGGKVDGADGGLDALGLSPQDCGRALAMDDPAQAAAFFVAAIRELHEEARVLLFADAAGCLVQGATAAALTEAMDGLRQGHRVDAAAHHRLLLDAGLRPDLSQLAPFARWVTPRIEPRRFDTVFFAALVPSDQRAGLDGYEITHALWCRPETALAEHAAGGAIVLPPPTLHTLERLRQLPGPAEATLRALAQTGVGRRIEPHFIADSDDGPLIALPDDPLHPDYAADTGSGGRGAAQRNRFVLRDGRFTRRSTPGAL